MTQANNPQQPPGTPAPQPATPATEINPGKPATTTEVDLDTSKIKTY